MRNELMTEYDRRKDDSYEDPDEVYIEDYARDHDIPFEQARYEIENGHERKSHTQEGWDAV